MKKAKKGLIGNAQYKDARLARVRAKTRVLVKQGKTFKVQSTSNRIFNCPVCGCPVTDSRDGRKAHGQRQQRCRDAMEKFD